MPREVPLTEFTDLEPEELHYVKSGANGFPPLLAKAAAEEVEAAKAESDTPSDEADEIESMMTKEACGDDECEICTPAMKAKLSAADRKKIPKKKFAIPEKAPGSGSYPIADRAHAVNALARASGKPVEARVRAAVHRAYPDLAGAKKSPGVPDAATSEAMLREGGHVTSTGQSMHRVAPMTDGTKPIQGLRTQGSETPAVGGQSTYSIPNEAKVEHPMQTAMAAKVAYVVSSLAQFQQRMTEQRAQGATKGVDWMAMDNPSLEPTGAAATDVGSGPWESYDSATLHDVAHNLAACGHAIDAIQKREAIEAVNGNVGDIADTQDLGSAGMALDAALGIVARLAFHEGAAAKEEDEAIKVRLGNTTESALRAARDHLADLLGEGSHNKAGAAVPSAISEEEKITMELTKNELADIITKAVDARFAAQKEAKKKAKAAKESANNKGDIDQAGLEAGVHSTHDANDIASVGGSVDSGYMNKAEAEALRKQVAETNELVKKMAARPRPGGPVLTGAIPEGLVISGEGRVGETVTKSAEDQAIEKLEKELETALASKNQQWASDVSYRLSKAQLVKMHGQGDVRIPVPGVAHN